MCPQCRSTNVTEHMVWDGHRLVGGNRRCEQCNTIFGDAAEQTAPETPVEEAAGEGDESEPEEPARRGRKRSTEEAD